MGLISFLLLSSLLLSGSTASSAHRKIVKMPMRHRRDHSAGLEALSKRSSISASLERFVLLGQYFVTVGIGNPGQVVELGLSTGSSDIVVVSPAACDKCAGGTYEPGSSKTSNISSGLGDFLIHYQGQSQARGHYYEDSLTIGGVEVQNITVAVADFTHGNFNSGVFGIGPDTFESYTNNNAHSPYPNLPDQLYNQGYIVSKSYSLYLDDTAESTGSLLFGGYDTNKFYGDIVMLKIQPNPLDNGILDTVIVSLTNFGFSFGGMTFQYSSPHDPYPIPVLLEFGTTLSYFPYELILPFINDFNLKPVNSSDPFGLYLIPCDLEERKTGPNALLFQFGSSNNGPLIKVDIREMIFPFYDKTNGEQESICVFGLVPTAPGQIPTLGQTFLRSAYILFDLNNLEIGLAQASFESKSSNVLEYNGGSMERITTDVHEPPAHTVLYASSTYFRHYPTSVKVQTFSESITASYPGNFHIPTVVPTELVPGPGATVASSGSGSSGGNGGQTGGNSNSNSNDSGGNSHLGVEVGVPVAVVGALVIAGLLFFVWRRKRRASQAAAGGVSTEEQGQRGDHLTPGTGPSTTTASGGMSPSVEHKTPVSTYSGLVVPGTTSPITETTTAQEPEMSSRAGPYEMMWPVELSGEQVPHEMDSGQINRETRMTGETADGTLAPRVVSHTSGISDSGISDTSPTRSDVPSPRLQ